MGASVLQDGRPTGGRIIHPRDAPFSLTIECFLNTAGADEPPVWSPRDMTGCTASLYLGSTVTQSLDPVVSGADDNVVTLSLTRVESLSASGSVWEVKTAGGVGVAGGDWVWASPGETRSPTSTDIITGGRVLMLESEGRVTLQAATAQMPAAAILAELLAVDGAGSGLDADLLDGQSSAHYATAASVTAEALARSTQDGVLAAAITAEATARAAADSALDGRIDTLEADPITATEAAATFAALTGDTFTGGITLDNGADADFLDAIVVKAGDTAQFKRYFAWVGIDDVVDWRMGANAGSQFILYDNQAAGIHTMIAVPLSAGGQLQINAQGSGATTFNQEAGSSNGGVHVWSGGAVPARWAAIDGTGFRIFQAGTERVRITQAGNVGIRTTDHGGATGSLAMGNAVAVPTTNPVGGGVLYVQNGALMFRGSSGTVTMIAPA